jgi:hypothetical protein
MVLSLLLCIHASNSRYYLSSSASMRATLVLAHGAWREEREVEDGGELIGEDKDDRELDGEDEGGGGSTGQ